MAKNTLKLDMSGLIYFVRDDKNLSDTPTLDKILDKIREYEDYHLVSEVIEDGGTIHALLSEWDEAEASVRYMDCDCEVEIPLEPIDDADINDRARVVINFCETHDAETRNHDNEDYKFWAEQYAELLWREGKHYTSEYKNLMVLTGYYK